MIVVALKYDDRAVSHSASGINVDGHFVNRVIELQLNVKDEVLFSAANRESVNEVVGLIHQYRLSAG